MNSEPLTAQQCGASGLCERRKGHEGEHTTSVERAEITREAEQSWADGPQARRVWTKEGWIIVFGPIPATLGAQPAPALDIRSRIAALRPWPEGEHLIRALERLADTVLREDTDPECRECALYVGSDENPPPHDHPDNRPKGGHR